MLLFQCSLKHLHFIKSKLCAKDLCAVINQLFWVVSGDICLVTQPDAASVKWEMLILKIKLWKCLLVLSAGMNAAVRAVVRMGIYVGAKVYFIHEVRDTTQDLDESAVSVALCSSLNQNWQVSVLVWLGFIRFF